MKKILFAITKSNWGGAQRYVYDLATNLPQNSYESVVALGGSGVLDKKLLAAGIKVVRLPSLQENTGMLHVLFSRSTLTALPELIRLIREEKPDIIHLNSSKISGLGAVAAIIYNKFYAASFSAKGGSAFGGEFQAKTVFTAHGWAFNEDRNLFSKTIIYMLQWLTSFLCDRTIILSNRDYQLAINMPFSPKNKFVLIPLGLPERSLNQMNKTDSRKALSELAGTNLYEGKKPAATVAVIGELNKNKGLRYLIDAVNRAKFRMLNSKERVQKRIDDFKCLIMGDGEDKAALEKMIHTKFLGDSVHLLGFVPEASKYLKAADLFVLSSLKEGLPYTVLEAMHAGTPVIATPAGGLRDLVENGENGRIVPFKDPESLGKAIKETLEDEELRKKFAKESLKRVKTRFSFDQMLKHTLALYEN